MSRHLENWLAAHSFGERPVAVTSSVPTVADYFEAIAGTYSIGDFTDARVILDQGMGGAHSNELTLQSLTVEVTSSVPEIDPAGFGSVAAAPRPINGHP